MITILNSPRLTNYGCYEYRSISVSDVKALLSHGFTSFVGHQTTADLLTTILGVVVEHNRSMYYQQPGDMAIIFENTHRLQEYDILDSQDLDEIDFRFGLLIRSR